jgi:hypothetical protein
VREITVLRAPYQFERRFCGRIGANPHGRALVKNWLVIRISQVPDVFRQKFGDYGVKYIIAKNSDGIEPLCGQSPRRAVQDSRAIDHRQEPLMVMNVNRRGVPMPIGKLSH